MDTFLPSDQCERKIKLHNLFKEIAELSDFSLIPSLINHFQKEFLNFQNQNDFFVDFPSNKEKQKIYFGYRNFIDALTWLYVKEEDMQDNEHDPVGRGFVFSTSQIVKLLKIPKGDLFALREVKELEENIHYIRENRNSKAAARYAPILYNIELTCSRAWGISYKDFCKPDFDLEKHKKERTEEYYKNKRGPWIPPHPSLKTLENND
tara:strand:+ start:550 stop:1170 length:621 start_codon:yes stop_codon:yes gene_type:complete